jgi:hypothetical protein
MQYKITDIDLKADTPECKTPGEILSCIMSICNKVFPNLQPEIKGFENTGMNEYQIAYSLAKVLYAQMFEEANNATESECKRIGLKLERGDDKALDRWSEIDSKYSEQYCVHKFMFLKWQAERMMVDWSFKVIESDRKLRGQLAKNKTDYERVKANLERPDG